MRVLAFLLGLLLFPATANGYDAPFGLRWGMSVDELSALVGENNVGRLTSIELVPGVVIYKIPFVNAPLTPSNTNIYIGEFIEEAGLIGVTWTSVDISTNNIGSEGYEYYLKLKKLISEKYSPNKTIVHIYRGEVKLEDEPYMLYECLSHDACGKYTTDYILDDGGSIEVRLHRQTQYRLYATIEYHANNYLESFEKAFTRANKQQEETVKQQDEIRKLDKKAF